MGMDLLHINPATDHRTGKYIARDLQYNWSAWRMLEEMLDSWGVDTSEFRFVNDREVISADTCRRVADALESHQEELEYLNLSWLKGHIPAWRDSGGFEQA